MDNEISSLELSRFQENCLSLLKRKTNTKEGLAFIMLINRCLTF